MCPNWCLVYQTYQTPGTQIFTDIIGSKNQKMFHKILKIKTANPNPQSIAFFLHILPQ